MARATPTKGLCAFCNAIIPKVSATRHFAKCIPWQTAVAAAEASKRPVETLYHLRIQAQGAPDYWLNLEMRGSAKLKALDHYLKEIWLECCGHLSQFSKDGFGDQVIPMNRTLTQALHQYPHLTHIYDFGTESVTLIKPVSQREGKPLTAHPLTLLMRNQPPEFFCQECQQPATALCLECVYEDGAEGLLCARHAAQHPHDGYGEPIALVNSPRLGLCGYTGPAVAPY
jgi:hypothetical protein